MKNIKKYIIRMTLCSAVLGSVLACSDSWLETRPNDLIIDGEFWKTREQLTAAVAGCYAAVINSTHAGNGKPYYGVVGKMIQWGEIRADNIVPTTSALEDEVKMATCNLSASNQICSWSELYAVINNCNMVMDNADRVLETDKTIHPSEVNALKAEALAIRSLMYFYLVRTYKEVPLVLKGSKTSTQNFDVAKVGEDTIIAQIIDDLLLARSWAVYSYDQPRTAYDKGRFTRVAITALLADVYLWAEQYQNCINACDEILSNKEVRLAQTSQTTLGSPWYSIFTSGNSNESIFELQYGNTLGGLPNNMLYQCYGSSTTAHHFVAPVEANSWSLNTLFLKSGSTTEFDKTDIRMGSFDGFDNNSRPLTTGTTTVSKFPMSETRSANWIVYRLAEIYFMKAEALNALDFAANKAEAIHLVNTIYMRAHPAALPGDTVYVPANFALQAELTNVILNEKQKEFLFEGKRWYDLLRTSRREKENPNRVFTEFIARNISYEYREPAISKYTNEWARYLPVPYDDLKTNKLLKQNPFYVTSLDVDKK
jgi:hypothetical protein